MLIRNLPGWPGINGKEEYINSGVLIPLILLDGEYHFIFQKRHLGIRQGGEICFPGGQFDIDKDYTLERTAIRETVEEMGISEDKIKIIGRLDTVVAPMGVTIDAFLGVLDVSEGEMRVNPAEVERVFTIPVNYFTEHEPDNYQVMIKIHPTYIDSKSNQEITLFPAEELGLPEKYRKPWGGFKYGVLVYKTDEGIIWGITARLIYDVVNKI